jgi:hypothetical protein
MPYAVCCNCGKRVPWRNQRGVRLKDLRCQCGGPLRKKTHAEIEADNNLSRNEWRILHNIQGGTD